MNLVSEKLIDFRLSKYSTIVDGESESESEVVSKYLCKRITSSIQDHTSNLFCLSIEAIWFGKKIVFFFFEEKSQNFSYLSLSPTMVIQKPNSSIFTMIYVVVFEQIRFCFLSFDRNMLEWINSVLKF